MAWISVIVASAVLLGISGRAARRSAHVLLLVVVASTVGVVFVGMLRAQ